MAGSMRAEILERRSEGWVWLDDRVDVDAGFETSTEAVEAGLAAVDAALEEGDLGAEEAADLLADARFELASNEHHLGGQDSDAIDALADREEELRAEAVSG